MAPRDYKARSARSKDKPARAAPRRGAAAGAGNVARWRWFGAGLCVGAVATASLFLYEPSAVRQVAGAPGGSAKSADAPPRTRFEFYTLLTEKEMVIPESEIEQSVPKAPPAATKTGESAAVAGAPPVSAAIAASEARGQYLLQVGSFRKLEDADRLKARLAFLGLAGSIQTISIDGQETWHRVRVGPYNGRTQLDEARATLKANDYDVLLLKLKGQ